MFLTVFPYSWCFWTLFVVFFFHFSSVFCFFVGFFESVKKIFLAFLMHNFEVVGGCLLIVGPVKSDLSTRKLGAPEIQHYKLTIHSCTLQLQLTIMSDENSPITFQQKLLSRCPDSKKQKLWRGPSFFFWKSPFYTQVQFLAFKYIFYLVYSNESETRSAAAMRYFQFKIGQKKLKMKKLKISERELHLSVRGGPLVDIGNLLFWIFRYYEYILLCNVIYLGACKLNHFPNWIQHMPPCLGCVSKTAKFVKLSCEQMNNSLQKSCEFFVIVSFL